MAQLATAGRMSRVLRWDWWRDLLRPQTLIILVVVLAIGLGVSSGFDLRRILRFCHEKNSVRAPWRRARGASVRPIVPMPQ